MWQLSPHTLLLVSHRSKAPRPLLQCQTALILSVTVRAVSLCSAALIEPHWGSEKVKVFHSRFGWSPQTWNAWGTFWWYKACVILHLPQSVGTTKTLLLTKRRGCAFESPWVTRSHMVCQLYVDVFSLVLQCIEQYVHSSLQLIFLPWRNKRFLNFSA